ncbi:hypothetical protein M0R01_04695 [bacterium]|nr:hypothetical protein [bacterium]
MKKENIVVIIFFCFNLFPFYIAHAQPNLENITYPVAELGQCNNREECEKYCNEGKNMIVCINYAEKNNLLSKEDIKTSKIVAEKITKGETPGQCKTREECESFCKGSIENINQCVAFGESLGVIPEKELVQAKKIIKILKDGASTPGKCKTKDECESYCANNLNIDECLNFAEKAEILTLDEVKEARRVAQFIKDETTPGKCKNKNECEKYCSDISHLSECVTFAEKAGFISKKEAEIAQKAGGIGPGGCKGQQECEAYCNDTSHHDECVKFGMEKDILTEQEKDLVKNGLEKMEGALNNLPSDIKEDVSKCLEGSIGKERLEKIRSKAEPITKEIGAKIDACFAGVGEKMKEKAMKSIPSGGTPTGAPSGISSGGGAGTMPSSDSAVPTNPNISCDNFRGIPSCNLVPAGVARDACNRCK